MPTIDLGNVKGDKGDTGVSMRTKGAWTASTSYVNNTQYIDVVTYGGSSYACKTSHTSGTSFVSDKWNLIAQKGEKGDIGITPTIKAGTATVLEATSAPTVSATTSGNTTTFNFGIPKGDTSEIKTPTFDDSIDTYSTLDDANDAAETASNAIKSKVSIFTTLSNMKKSFSAIIQGLKILGTNVGAIRGITSDVAGESENIAASIKVVNQINSNLAKSTATTISTDYFDFVIRKYGCFAIISFNRCKKTLPISTPINFNIPDGFRAAQLITKMVTVGRAKLSTYLNTSSSGSTSITIYDGLEKDVNVYAEIFYFAKL